jgi:hypothetical protein
MRGKKRLEYLNIWYTYRYLTFWDKKITFPCQRGESISIKFEYLIILPLLNLKNVFIVAERNKLPVVCFAGDKSTRYGASWFSNHGSPSEKGYMSYVITDDYKP